MASPRRQTNAQGELEPAIYPTGEISRVYATMNNVPCGPNGEPDQEQQTCYNQAQVMYHQINTRDPAMYTPEPTNGYIMNQYTSAGVPAQFFHQMQPTAYTSMPLSSIQPPSVHSYMNQQQTLVNAIAPHTLMMNNLPTASTPIHPSTKRGRNDNSGISDTNVQLQPHQYQSIGTVTSNSTVNKRQRRIIQQTSEQVDPIGDMHGGEESQDVRGTNTRQQQPSLAACRFAETRFPFSPFSVTFSQEVRAKVIVDELLKHAADRWNFALKTVAYRRGRADNDDCRILIFVENSESFAFLYNDDNWPATLSNLSYTKRCPSIPPQLALVLPAVSIQVDWEEFVQELKDKYPSVVNVIRLRNKAQQPIRAVKLELMSPKERDDMLRASEVGILHMKYKVVEYFAQARVLICSNCYGIGHFRRNCPQKEEATCKTCGEKTLNLRQHECSGVPKCVHCSGAHSSNDVKCEVVKDYRAALTRNLLANNNPMAVENATVRPSQRNKPIAGVSTNNLPYTTEMQTCSQNSNDTVCKKLDDILAKVEAEFGGIRQSIGEIKDEMCIRWEAAKKQVDALENKVKIIESKMADVSMRVYTIIQNICTSLLDPQGVQGGNWKTYWQDQVKTLMEIRASGPKPPEG